MLAAAVAGLLASATPVLAQSGEVAGSLHGKIVDAVQRTPIAGSTVTLRETGRREISHADGSFHFERLAPGRYTVQVDRIGYAPAAAQVAVVDGGRAEVEVALRAAAIHVDALTVTAPGGEAAGEILRPSAVLDGAELRRRLAATIPATLAGQPGITQSYNGPGASQPVIRGLSGNRVLVLEDGQRTGDIAGSAADHGVMVDPLAAERVEVVRGPASLLYGSNALGGVVNVVRHEVPRSLPDRPTGTLALHGESASGGVTGGGALTRAVGSWAVRGEGTVRRLGDTRTALGRLPTSDLAGASVAVGASRVASAGHAGVAVRHYDARYGVPGEFAGREIPGAHQGGVYIEVERTALRGEAARSRAWGPFSGATAELSLVRFDHREMERGDDGAEFVGTRFLQHLGTFNLAARLGKDGAAGLWAQARDRNATGSNTGSRPAREWVVAGYGYRRATLGPVRLEGGARYDWTRVVPQSGASVGGVEARARAFGSVSASGAAVWEVGRGLELGARAARAFRTPSIEELYSRGPHLAAFSYEIGNPELDAETGVGGDLFIRLARPHVHAEVTVFRNGIRDFIHYAPTGALDPRFGRYPVYRARGRDARFVGAEAQLQWEPVRAWALEGSFSHVRADGRADGGWEPLPAIPAAQGGVRLRRDVPRWFAELGVSGAARQDRVAPGTVGGRPVEAPTAAYLLADAGAGVRLDAGGWLHTLTVQVDNALDAAWREHTSRLRAVAPGPGINARLLYRVDF